MAAEAGGSCQDEFEKIMAMSKDRAGLDKVIIMQKRYEYFVRRYGRVLGMRPHRRKSVATDSTRRPPRAGEFCGRSDPTRPYSAALGVCPI